MSKTPLAEQFSFNSRTFHAYAGPNGDLLHIAHETKTIFRRPDRLSVEVTGDDGSIKILYDGKNMVLFGVEQNKYESIPVTGRIFKALRVVEERTDTDFSLADLLSDDPGKSVLSGVTSGGQVGMAEIDGVRCRHFFFVQAPDDLELELWLEDNERSLPRRFVVTYRSLPGRPIFIAELSNWNFAIQAPDSDFEFNPAAGVTRVELQPARRRHRSRAEASHETDCLGPAEFLSNARIGHGSVGVSRRRWWPRRRRRLSRRRCRCRPRTRRRRGSSRPDGRRADRAALASLQVRGQLAAPTAAPTARPAAAAP
jgi:hypothetical protein